MPDVSLIPVRLSINQDEVAIVSEAALQVQALEKIRLSQACRRTPAVD
jgi:hypothetical protein